MKKVMEINELMKINANELRPLNDNELMVLNEDQLLATCNPEKYHPYLYHLRNVDWLIFGTLTWRRPSRRHYTSEAEGRRKKDFGDLMKLFRTHFGIGRKNLCLYKATECGAGEAHYHFLIARDGLDHLSAPECAQWLKNAWCDSLTAFDSTRKGIGDQAKVVPYDDAKGSAGVAYCLKREWDGFGVERERYDYLSDGLERLLKRENHSANKNDFLSWPCHRAVENRPEVSDSKPATLR